MKRSAAHIRRRLGLAAGLSAILTMFAAGPARAGWLANPLPPASPVKLIFIHHSTGENWLNDANGGLGIALRDNRYFVSDTNYGWGGSLSPSRDGQSIGSTTDIGDWYTWFRGPNAANYTAALFAESGQNASYSRLGTDPGGDNEIVMFKSCFPNSGLQGSATETPPAIGDNLLKGEDCGSADHTVANAKGIYIDIRDYFLAHPEKLFVAIAAPPLSDPTHSSNARAFNNWLVNDWLTGYGGSNVFVFDFYNVLTTNGGSSTTNDLGLTTGNHHRMWAGAIQHITNGDNGGNPNVLEYPTSSGDDHPSKAGNMKATAEFLPLLNVAYNRWKGNTGEDTTGPTTYAPHRAYVHRGHIATFYYRVTDSQSPSAVVSIGIKTLGGATVKRYSLGLRSTGVERGFRFRCNLSPRTYRVYVWARDEAGNSQSRTGTNLLIVRR